MENLEEAFRLEVKTRPEAVREQARWCGVSPGLTVLDAGCGPGKVTAILHEMIGPEGRILGVDYSDERIRHARDKYGAKPGIDFRVHDLRDPMDDTDRFDLIWVRFVLEYNLTESAGIIRNLTRCLRPGGSICLMDLDHNCLNHYPLPRAVEKILFELAEQVERAYGFDPYAGRKLYAYLYDLGYEEIRMDVRPHHLIYGDIEDTDVFNWIKKAEVISAKAPDVFREYPGGHRGFFDDFMSFLNDPRRFTYTPLILCRGRKPVGRTGLR